jgi:tetratricopeptide (TPR) repeat protein
MTIPVPDPIVSPAVQTETAALLSKWEEGGVSYEDVIARFDVLMAEAIAAKRHNDHGQIEYRRGMIEGYRGSYETSIKHFENARDLFIAGGMRRRVIACHLNIGETYRLKGNFTRARQYFRIGYEAALELGHREMQVTCRINEAQMLVSLGYMDQAETTLLECYTLAREPFPYDADRDPERVERGRLSHLVDITKALATIYSSRRQANEAWNYARECYTIAYQLTVTLLMGFADRAMGEAISLNPERIEDGVNPDPDYYFQQSISHLKEVNAEAEIARTLLAQGRSLIGRGKRTQAARKLNQAIAIFNRLNLIDEASRAAEEQLKLL